MASINELNKGAANEPLLDEKEKTVNINTDDTSVRDVRHQTSVDVQRKKSVVLLETKKNETNIIQHNEWNMVPPDGGWGWLVLFGATLVNILVPGMIKSFGVLFVEFLEAFNASPSEGMWIPALCYFLYSSLGPVSSILSLKYSYRTVTVIGGIFAATGMILSFWANSVYYLYLTYGVLVGTGAGLSFPPTVYIVCSYFMKLRGVANGICISGSAFGSILIPPILRILLVKYGYRGAVLLMGGVTLNVFVAALFYDKVDKHMKRVPVENKEDDYELPVAKFIISQDDNMPPLNQLPQNDFLSNSESSKGNFNRSASSAAVQNIKSQHRERKISMPTGKCEIMKAKSNQGSKHNISSSVALHVVPKNQNGNPAMDMFSHNRLPHSRRRAGVPKRSTSTSSFKYVSTPYHGSTLTLQPETFASSFSLKSNSNKGNSNDKERQKKNIFFDINLLKDPLYLIILISNATNAISYTNFIILLPAYAKTLSFTKDEGALLLSIVSALDLVGRIGGSALSDLTHFSKCWYFVGGLFTSGICLTIMPYFENYWAIAAFCSVFGLASGTYVGITAIVMADMLGEERLQATYGMGLFVNGILQLVGPPLCGLWYDAMKSFVSLFIFLGLIETGGSLLWCLTPYYLKKAKINKVKTENSTEYNN